MDHDRSVLFAVGAHISEIESLRHLKIQLNRTALPRSLQAVLQMEVQFRTVKRSVAFIDYKIDAFFFETFSQPQSSPFPTLRQIP